MEPQLVTVKWKDAWGQVDDLVSPEDAHHKHQPMLMLSVGWVLKDDEVGISLFSERCLDQGEGTFRGRAFIPRAMIESVEPVVKAKKVRKSGRGDVQAQVLTLEQLPTRTGQSQ